MLPDLVDDVGVLPLAPRTPPPPVDPQADDDDGQEGEPDEHGGVVDEVVEQPHVHGRREDDDVGEDDVRQPPPLVTRASAAPGPGEHDDRHQGDRRRDGEPHPWGSVTKVEERQPLGRVREGEDDVRDDDAGGTDRQGAVHSRTLSMPRCVERVLRREGSRKAATSRERASIPVASESTCSTGRPERAPVRMSRMTGAASASRTTKAHPREAMRRLGMSRRLTGVTVF